MTSITEIQRLNEMTKELRSHGMAFSSDDAVQNARKMIDTKDIDENVFSSQAILLKEEKKTEAKDVSKDDLIRAMEENAKYVAEQMKAFKTEISSMKTDIENLRKEIVGIRINSAREEIKEKPIRQSTSQMMQQAAQQTPAEPHPRQGNFEQKEVSIEKMFYFGKK
ncbi:MAG: hypothetical protein QW331_00340 [Candidatus Woesearchaeota archaeon]